MASRGRLRDLTVRRRAGIPVTPTPMTLDQVQFRLRDRVRIARTGSPWIRTRPRNWLPPGSHSSSSTPPAKRTKKLKLVRHSHRFPFVYPRELGLLHGLPTTTPPTNPFAPLLFQVGVISTRPMPASSRKRGSWYPGMTFGTESVCPTCHLPRAFASALISSFGLPPRCTN